MPPRTRKRKVSVDINEAEAPALKKPATRKAPQRKRRTARADSSPDATRQSVEQANSSKKPRLHISEAKKQLYGHRDAFIRFIEEEAKTNQSSFDKETVFGKEVSPDLLSAFPWLAEPSKTQAQKPSEPPPHTTAKTAMTEFQGILDTYEKINKKSIGIKKPTWMRWNQDGKDLTELNQHAMAFATQTVNETIMPGPQVITKGPPEQGGDISTMAWELMQEGKPEETEETWGSAAQGQVLAFTRILRLLPNENGKG